MHSYDSVVPILKYCVNGTKAYPRLNPVPCLQIQTESSVSLYINYSLTNSTDFKNYNVTESLIKQIANYITKKFCFIILTDKLCFNEKCSRNKFIRYTLYN